MCLMRTVATPNTDRLPATKVPMRRVPTATPHIWDGHVLGVRAANRAFAGDDISAAKYYDFDKDFLVYLEPYSTHYEMCDR
jgi:hypothetical protein